MKIKNFKCYEDMLIIVDMINGFVKEGALHDKTIANVVPRQIELIKEAKSKGSLIVFIKDTHTNESTEHKRFGVKHCIKGSGEEEIIDELKQFENDSICFEKNSTSFYVAQGFKEMLDNLENLKRVDVVGCCTDICITNGVLPMMNYFDEYNRCVDVYIHEDGIETYDAPIHNREEYTNAAKLLLIQQGAKLVKKR